MMLQLWTDSYNDGKNGKQSFVFLKFKDPRKFQVSLEEPVIE